LSSPLNKPSNRCTLLTRRQHYLSTIEILDNRLLQQSHIHTAPVHLLRSKLPDLTSLRRPSTHVVTVLNLCNAYHCAIVDTCWSA
jgi:hypothetical protein